MVGIHTVTTIRCFTLLKVHTFLPEKRYPRSQLFLIIHFKFTLPAKQFPN